MRIFTTSQFFLFTNFKTVVKLQKIIVIILDLTISLGYIPHATNHEIFL